ncbi:MAG: RrF2 family transcriptional regulator [Thermodesulfobacteriota bacterium]
MKISTKIRYGTRAMLELATHYGEGPIELREIANRENISLKYLEQLIVPLRSAGLVKSARGSKGGYALAKHPSQIYLKDLVETLEGPLGLIECLGDPRACERAPYCVTREIWKQVSEAIDGVLCSLTLEDMVRRKGEKEFQSASMYQI